MPLCLIFAAIATPAPSILDLIAQSGAMARTILFGLFVLSVLSWGIIAERWRTLRRAETETLSFLDRFRSSSDLAELGKSCEALRFSPVVALFRAGFRELNRGASRASQRPADAGSHPDPPDRVEPAQIDRRVMSGVERMLERAAHEEIRNLERSLTFLATTASVAPFVGLFGTVWGIMNAFREIGAAGNASIASSAPGIAEALVTTAAGLAAAIPAVIAYNHFSRRVRVLSTQMDEFATDFIHLIEQYVP